VGRYSLITLGRWATLTVRGQEIHLHPETGCPLPAQQGIRRDPLSWLDQISAALGRENPDDDLPFHAGLVGYLGYEMVQFTENIPVHPIGPEDPPDAFFIIPRLVLIHDSVRRCLHVLASWFDPDPDGTAAQEAREAIRTVRERVTLLPGLPAMDLSPRQEAGNPPQSSPSREVFEDWVQTLREGIHEGEIYQAVPSRTVTLRTRHQALALYRQLRRSNPSPYLFCLHCGDFDLIGSSPEVMVQLRQGRLLTKPIAGTRPRGTTPREDLALEQELLADVKEKAEHIMLVDLARNDLGRISLPGTVRVDDFMRVERYSHVMHLVSTVSGDLDPQLGPWDVIRAVFPAGTLTGAPKVRAMEWIHRLEPTRRGPYGGMVLYLDTSGRMDSCITIRTIRLQGDQAIVQAGAGIVFDSDPHREYLETQQKAGILLDVLGAGTATETEKNP